MKTCEKSSEIIVPLPRRIEMSVGTEHFINHYTQLWWKWKYSPKYGIGGEVMRALSINQPWSWLLTHTEYLDPKNIENRNWTTSYRGLVLIHAGKIVDGNFFTDEKEEEDRRLFLPYAVNVCGEDAVSLMPQRLVDYERGGIVGYATLQKVVTESTSRWFRGPYGFVLTQRHTVPFIPLRGKPSLFDVSQEIEAIINEIRDQHAWTEDAKDMEQIKREWEIYRHEGDETPPTSLRRFV